MNKNILTHYGFIDTGLQGRWQWNTEDVTNASTGAALQTSMARHRRSSECPRVHPHVVLSSMMVKKAIVRSEMSFKVATIHEMCPLAC